MDKTLSIIIADDDSVLVWGLKEVLTKADQRYKVQIAANADEAMRMLRKEKTDIIFLDIEMPGMAGAESVRKINEKFPETKIIIFSIHRGRGNVFGMMSAGIKGYILKESKRTDILSAVRQVAEGGRYYSPEIYEVMESIIKESVLSGSHENGRNGLTEMEKKIFLLDCKGYRTHEIAVQCCITESTIGTHRKNYRIKTGVDSVHEMHIYAIEYNMIQSLEFFSSP